MSSVISFKGLLHVHFSRSSGTGSSYPETTPHVGNCGQLLESYQTRAREPHLSHTVIACQQLSLNKRVPLNNVMFGVVLLHRVVQKVCSFYTSFCIGRRKAKGIFQQHGEHHKLIVTELFWSFRSGISLLPSFSIPIFVLNQEAREETLLFPLCP